jgi:hypothetical protein
LACGLGDGGGGLALEWDALEGGAPDGGTLGVGVPEVLSETETLGVPLAEPVGVAGLDPPGENDGGVVGGELDEQADTDTVASMVKAACPAGTTDT